MLDVLSVHFLSSTSFELHLGFIIDPIISIKQRYNHTSIREYLFVFLGILLLFFPT